MFSVLLTIDTDALVAALCREYVQIPIPMPMHTHTLLHIHSYIHTNLSIYCILCISHLQTVGRHEYAPQSVHMCVHCCVPMYCIAVLFITNICTHHRSIVNMHTYAYRHYMYMHMYLSDTHTLNLFRLLIHLFCIILHIQTHMNTKFFAHTHTHSCCLHVFVIQHI